MDQPKTYIDHDSPPIMRAKVTHTAKDNRPINRGGLPIPKPKSFKIKIEWENKSKKKKS